MGASCLLIGVAMAPAAHAQNDIANGTAVPDGAYPWAVSLHAGSTPAAANTFCSGSHIAPSWVLTAQHCFDTNLDGTPERAGTNVWVSLNGRGSATPLVER